MSWTTLRYRSQWNRSHHGPTVSLSLCLHWCKLQTRARSAAAARKTFCHSSATGREQLHIWHTEDYIRIWTTRETWTSRSAVQALFLALELTVPWDPIASRRSVPPLRPGDMHFICSSCSEIHICKDCLGKLWSPKPSLAVPLGGGCAVRACNSLM